MKQTIGLSQFIDAFMSIRPKNFTYEGLEILFQGIEEFEEDTNEEIELDVIAICCDFSEMSESEIKQSYNVNLEESSQDMDDWLSNQTWVLGKTDIDTYVFRQF